MVCNKCGSEILDNSKFCNKCGHKIKTSSALSNIFKKKSSKMIACIMLILILISICGYNYYSNLPPKNVRKEIYTGAIKYINQLDEFKKNNYQSSSSNEQEELLDFVKKYRKDATPEEDKVLEAVSGLQLAYDSDVYSKVSGYQPKNYDKAVQKLKSLLGKK